MKDKESSQEKNGDREFLRSGTISPKALALNELTNRKKLALAK
jgi:hypothetical protein